jgi:hypothetical protein
VAPLAGETSPALAGRGAGAGSGARGNGDDEPLIGSEDALHRVVLLAAHGGSPLVWHTATIKPSPACHPDRNGHDCRYRALQKRGVRFQMAVGGDRGATVLAGHGQPPYNRVSLAPQQGLCLPPEDFAALASIAYGRIAGERDPADILKLSIHRYDQTSSAQGHRYFWKKGRASRPNSPYGAVLSVNGPSFAVVLQL